MTPTAAAYPNSSPQSSRINQPSDRALRQALSDFMVEVNLITRELAEYHIQSMTDLEVEERFRMQTGMELSAVGPKLKPETCLLPRCSGRGDETRQTSRHSTLFPESTAGKDPKQRTAGFGRKSNGVRSSSARSESGARRARKTGKKFVVRKVFDGGFATFGLV